MGPDWSLGQVPVGRKEGRTHRSTLGRITPSGHPCCYLKHMLPSIPPLTDLPSVHPATFSDSPDSISSCVLHCTAPHCTHLPVIDRARQTATLAPGLGHDRLWLSPGPDPVASQAWNLHSSFEVTVTGRWQKPTVAVASVSQAHATSVGSTADLRFAINRHLDTVVLWHTPRLNNAWDPLTVVAHPSSTYTCVGKYT